MSADRVVFIGMGEVGHFQRLRPLIAGIAERGVDVRVLTDRRFAAGVEGAGGRFDDLLGRYPLERADDESIPIPCRFVSFAGHFGDQVIEELAALDPALILYDTFAVIGHIAGSALGIPYVNVCAGHNRDPARFLAEHSNDPPPMISPACRRAVEVLRERYGLADASPFSYVSGLSPHLNVYCEPEEYLTREQRRVFEPIAFYGSLPDPALNGSGAGAEKGVGWPSGAGAGGPRIYAAFGTVVWRYWPGAATDALAAIAEGASSLPGATVLVSLGGAEVDLEHRRRLERAGAEVRDYVDQWSVLAEADVFFTHQGLNSTHEAIFHQVPMVSYPFFTDQPVLAERCRELGVSVPLSEELRGPVDAEDVRSALARVERERPAMERDLERARGWELRTIGVRGEVLDRILALA